MRGLQLHAETGKAFILAIGHIFEEVLNNGRRQNGGDLIFRVVAQQQAGEFTALDHRKCEAVCLAADDAIRFIDEEA